LLEEVTSRGLSVLCETPPAGDVPSLARVNELTTKALASKLLNNTFSSPCMPLAGSHSIGIARTISQAQISYTQAHHGMSLIRHYLGIGFDPVKITAKRFDFPIIKGPDRSGPPKEEKIITAPQRLACWNSAIAWVFSISSAINTAPTFAPTAF